MDDEVRDALERGRPLIDMTTTGRPTGSPRRIEIVYQMTRYAPLIEVTLDDEAA